MTYEERLKLFDPYIKAIASRTHEKLPFASYDELEQEILLALWRCHNKYPNYEFKQFKNTFSKAINFAVRDMLRRQKRERTTQLIDDITDKEIHGGDFFKIGIKDIIDSVSPESVVMILDSMDPNQDQSKKTWKQKKNSAACKKEITNFVYGK